MKSKDVYKITILNNNLGFTDDYLVVAENIQEAIDKFREYIKHHTIIEIKKVDAQLII